jgi:hypothetical protein
MFAVITTVVKYVRTINLYSQDIAKTFYQQKGHISWHTPSNLFDRFDLYFYVNIYYGTYERHATVPLLPLYQQYRRPYRLRTNGTEPPAPLCWSVCEHC